MTDISAILNVHREGVLAKSSLLSMGQAAEQARAAGLAVEIIAMADCTDQTTLDVLARHPGVRVVQTEVNDLGLARNEGVREARGRYLTFLDGDDLWGPGWLLRAHAAASQAAEPAVWHPEASLLFGQDVAPSWLPHPDGETAEGDWVVLGLRNHWTSPSFAERSVYERVPYRRTNIDKQFGYEDWNWNCETTAAGFIHRVVPDTAHLIRVRADSMVRRTIGTQSLMTPSSLFRSRIGWLRPEGAA